jgi:hypothetical protein
MGKVERGGIVPASLAPKGQNCAAAPLIADRPAFRVRRFTNTSFSIRVRASARIGLQIGGPLKPGPARQYRVTLGLGA